MNFRPEVSPAVFSRSDSDGQKSALTARVQYTVQHKASAIDVGVGRRTIHRDAPCTAEQ
jgi:hypothetical protein